ncbi:tigger transposable element-derived protein 6-like [Schistocerca nitens]|uniref:tigger transposable element-derived protein 6-like n=1 Tax=Schistocerca nitens TaxID=7011 RepID=UPI002118E475|nr:tigger transposable element-derived protein 6-like [Schistocerca nitens]
MEVFKDNDNGMKQVDMARKCGLAQSALVTFLKKRKEIEESFVGGKFNLSRKRMKMAAAADMDSATLQWFNEMCANNGWLQSLKDRHGIIFKLIPGEEKSEPLGDAEFWRKNTKCKLLEKYSPENLDKADETGLFYQLMPKKTMAFTGAKYKEGSRTHKLTPPVINQQTHRASKMYEAYQYSMASAVMFCYSHIVNVISFTAVNYKANRKAWMMSTLFSEWVLSFDKEMSMKNKKIALLVDNFKHVIANFERKVYNPCSFSVKKASSWNSVQPNVIANCWKNARISESEDLCENVVVDEIMQDGIQSDLEIYSAVTGKTIDASVVAYLLVDDESLVFEACTVESIIEELKGNSPVEDSDDDSDVISANPFL